jgi:hypothetical protein
LELAVILHCEGLGLKIANYNLVPIKYFNPTTQKIQNYYPDFIIEDFLIIEVKWIGFVYKKKQDEIRAKRAALESFCQSSRFESLFVTNNMIKKKHIQFARKMGS